MLTRCKNTKGGSYYLYYENKFIIMGKTIASVHCTSAIDCNVSLNNDVGNYLRD